MRHTAIRRTPVTVTKYFDEVVQRLACEGVDVSQIVLELSPVHPMQGELVTDRGPVLRWHEDLGWSNGSKSASPVAHPTEVAGLLEHL
ncbi:hypothetical protein ACIRG5_24505 [Lentzea sp. NPDC102401]|uniref:hypothetical protein n=1 Tax=Lentzea sp. NPDC102401 TaxID=3364128 RepID=UPI0037FB327B